MNHAVSLCALFHPIYSLPLSPQLLWFELSWDQKLAQCGFISFIAHVPACFLGLPLRMDGGPSHGRFWSSSHMVLSGTAALIRSPSDGIYLGMSWLNSSPSCTGQSPFLASTTYLWAAQTACMLLDRAEVAGALPHPVLPLQATIPSLSELSTPSSPMCISWDCG